jgi:uncharacterized repeat protein (TIGR02543 family)
MALILAFIFNACDNENNQQSKTYVVTFNSNGGNPVPEQQTVDNGGKVTQPVALAKEGHVFGGWYKETDFINKWDFSFDTVTENITLYAKWNPHIIVPGSDWTRKIRWLDSNVQNDNSYILEFDSNESISPVTFSFSNKSNIIIELRGIESNRIISLNNNGSMFTVESGVTLVLDNNLELYGRSDNDNPLITVKSGGSLILNNGASITANKNGTSYSGWGIYGGGVYVAGTLTMNGGEISGNHSYSTGGGVYVSYDGTFTMNGGEITGNSTYYNFGSTEGNGVYVNGGTFLMYNGIIKDNFFTSSYAFGGGVYIHGTFFMYGGTISGNSSSSGGGVYVYDGTFTMNDGEIYGNSATADYDYYEHYPYGGGVYIGSGDFNKTGGIIYGYTEGSMNNNVVKNSVGVVQQNKGHAIHVDNYNIYYIMGKDTTSDTNDNLSFYGNTFDSPIWSGDWDY